MLETRTITEGRKEYVWMRKHRMWTGQRKRESSSEAMSGRGYSTSNPATFYIHYGVFDIWIVCLKGERDTVRYIETNRKSQQGRKSGKNIPWLKQRVN